MNRLVAAVMLATLAAIIAQIAAGEGAAWAGVGVARSRRGADRGGRRPHRPERRAPRHARRSAGAPERAGPRDLPPAPVLLRLDRRAAGRAAGRGLSLGPAPATRAPTESRESPAERPQGIENDREVDALLQERPRYGRQIAGGRDRHRNDAEAHAGEHALARNVESAPSSMDGVCDTVDPVHRDDCVSRLGGDGRACRPHRDPDVRQRECRRVVDAVPDHHDG